MRGRDGTRSRRVRIDPGQASGRPRAAVAVTLSRLHCPLTVCAAVSLYCARPREPHRSLRSECDRLALCIDFLEAAFDCAACRLERGVEFVARIAPRDFWQGRVRARSRVGRNRVPRLPLLHSVGGPSWLPHTRGRWRGSQERQKRPEAWPLHSGGGWRSSNKTTWR